MGDVGRAGLRATDRGWRAGRVGTTALGLLLVEWLLLDEAGPPMGLARMLLGLGDPGADPEHVPARPDVLGRRGAGGLRPAPPGVGIAGHAARADGPPGAQRRARDDAGCGPAPGRAARRWRPGRPDHRGRGAPGAPAPLGGCR